jgi:hypothetical protein
MSELHPARILRTRAPRHAVLTAAAATALALSACGGAASMAAQAPGGQAGAVLGSGAPGTPATGTGAPARPSSAPPAGSHQTEQNPPGDIPDQQVFVPYTAPGAHFSVKVPEGWARSSGPAGVTFTDKLNSITIQEVPAAQPPTAAQARTQVLPQLAASVPAFADGRIAGVTRTAGPVVLLTYLGDSAADPVTNKVVRDAFEQYRFWRGGHEAVITLAGPKGADNVDPWRIVTDSLRWR